MLKLNASFSKKIPVEGQEFSSQSYHASVEVEIPDGLSEDQLRGRIHDTFDLVRTSVESELRNGGTAPVGRAPAPDERRDTSPRSNSGGGPRATGKQLAFLTDLAVRRGLDQEDLNARAAREYGVRDIGELTRKQASRIIDALNGKEDGQSRRAA